MPIRTRVHSKPKTKLDPLSRDFLRAVEKWVLIGISAESMHPGEKGEASINNAALGYLFEYGQPEMNLPARPHLIPGVDSIRDAAVQILAAGVRQALQGDLSAPERALNKVGIIGTSAVQAKIIEGDFAPLSPRTIKGRLRRGRTGTKPLIDTGAYRRAFTYTIQPRPLAGSGS
ncbi:hypothetical protein [Methylobacterium sp. J-067]|uniref:hypothetical protein n=1 Tax=Methylobacterium sp. J-067 TaxID=2836648 RepID=UPI001FBA3158|nr:hypothetical protein [Methylobacterium sp. J-067]MCJ2023928.1 hypothetical protein [Methylobacterium sp. J-067]